jgi:hypothetical protein
MKHLTPFLFAGLLSVVGCFKDSEADIRPGQSGSITRFVVYQGYMYALNQNEVQTWSMADADQPRLVHRLSTEYGLETIIIYEGTIYLGSRNALYILGLMDPARPILLSRTPREGPFLGACDPVVVQGHFAYSTVKTIPNACGQVGGLSGLLVYNVSDPSQPVQVGTYPMSRPNGLGYRDQYLFVCDEGSHRVEVFDIQDPLALVQTDYGFVLTEPLDLIVDGERLIVSSRTAFRFYDIRDITDIRPIGLIAK